ncbi:MAG TPA: NUDIX domain-containing protein [Chloroflexota bacterium]|nr:NUDIX domain-containing protein [Chloroflexota bacterium]
MTEPYYCCGTLYHAAYQSVLLHHRDPHAPVNPNTWALFGGGSEPADGGDPAITWIREMQEELGVHLSREQIIPLCDYLNPRSGLYRYVCYASWPSRDTQFQLGEGDGYAWFTLDEALTHPDLTSGTRTDLLRLGEYLKE